MGNIKDVMPTIIVGFIALILITFLIFKKTPKNERLGTWLRAWWLGLKVDFKIALCCTLIFIPFVMSHKSTISEKDVYFWEDGDRVFGDDGKEYTVSGFGSFINDGTNLRKIHTLNGEPYFEDGLNKIWLRTKQ